MPSWIVVGTDDKTVTVSAESFSMDMGVVDFVTEGHRIAAFRDWKRVVPTDQINWRVESTPDVVNLHIGGDTFRVYEGNFTTAYADHLLSAMKRLTGQGSE